MSILQKLQQFGEQLVRDRTPVNPAVFDDPLALNTEWMPLKRGGASFGTHRLVVVDETRLEMRKSVGSFLFGGVFLAVGLGTFAIGAVNVRWVQLLLGLAFAGVGLFAAWPTALVFNGTTRQILMGKGPVSFSTIHAVQIIKEHVRGNKSSYWSYELNLVLKDGVRLNVVDHGDLTRIRGDAQRISMLIGCKLWDATSVV